MSGWVADIIKAVVPKAFCALTSAPAPMSSVIASTDPAIAADISGVPANGSRLLAASRDVTSALRRARSLVRTAWYTPSGGLAPGCSRGTHRHRRGRDHDRADRQPFGHPNSLGRRDGYTRNSVEQELLSLVLERGDAGRPRARDVARGHAALRSVRAARTIRPGCRSAAACARTRTAGRASGSDRDRRRGTRRSARRRLRPGGTSRDRARESGSRRSWSARACGTSARRPPAGRTRRAAPSAFMPSAKRSASTHGAPSSSNGLRRAASFRDVGAFEQHRARIDDRASRASGCSATAAPTECRSRRSTCRGASPPSPRPRDRRRCRTSR